MKVVNLVDADINCVDLFRWLYHLVRVLGMLYLVEEIFLRLFWLPLLPWQLLLLQSAGCQIFPADLSSHLVFILVNDWSSLIKLTTAWIILSAAPWTCSVTFRGIDSTILRTYHILIKRIYTFHIQFHSFFSPLWVSVPYLECNTSLFLKNNVYIVKSLVMFSLIERWKKKKFPYSFILFNIPNYHIPAFWVHTDCFDIFFLCHCSCVCCYNVLN